MQTGQLHSPKPFIFRGLIAAALTCLLATACADSTQEALQKGAQAQQLLDQKQVRAAREMISEALDERDDIVELHLLRARIELAANSASNAYDAYYDAMSLDSANLEALMGVAQLGLMTSHFRDSIDATEKLLALDPSLSEARLLHGVQLIFRRRYDEAIAEANKVLEVNPDNLNGTILKSRALFLSGRENEALAVINSEKLIGQKNQPLALTRLELYRETGNAPMMLEQFAVLKSVNASTPAILIDEANTRYKTGDASQAMPLLVQAATNPQLSPNDARDIAGLWREYTVRGPDEAQLRAILAKPAPTAREEFARYFVEQGDARNAQRFISGLNTPNAQGLKARIYLLHGDEKAARALTNSILDRDETQCDALIVRSALLIGANDSTGGLRDAQRAAAECPANVDAWLAISRAYDVRSQNVGAQRAFLQGIAANPQNRRLAMAFANWLEKQGNHTAAVSAGLRLTRAAPALKSGWIFYGDLCRRLDPGCVAEAAAGLEIASKRYALDLVPGTVPPVSMFGRLTKR